MAPLSILIIGSGTSGLTGAVCLSRDGHKVTLIERSPALRLTGGSYRLTSNATRLLNSLGLQDQLEKVARIAPGVRMRRWDTGEIISTNEDEGVGGDTSAYSVQRQLVGETLYKTAIDSGVKVFFGKRVIDLNESTPSITLDDGTIMSADLIIGADGAKSTIRQKIAPPEQDKVLVSNEVAYNLYIPKEVMRSSPELTQLFNDSFTNWWVGPGAYAIAGIMDPKDAQFYLLICLQEDDLASSSVGKWNTSTDLRLLHSRMSQWDPQLSTMLRSVSSTEYWRIIELPHLSSWSSPSSKVVLIGDAAHAIGPHAGSGAAMGIEDAFALAKLLQTTEDIARAVELFQEFRRPRVKKIYELARRNWARLTIPDGPDQERRDENMKGIWKAQRIDWKNIKADGEAKGSSPEFVKWVQGYDTLVELRGFLERKEGEGKATRARL